MNKSLEKSLENKNEITSWQQLKDKKKIGKVFLNFPDEDEPTVVKIQGLNQNVINKINDKYDSMKPSEPITMIRPDKNAKPITVKVTEGKEWEDYQSKLKEIDSNKMAELALAFLVVKPEGTLDEQLKALSEDLLMGHFILIVQAGYEVSGFKLEEKVDQAKNS
jgi:hypothetical protein